MEGSKFVIGVVCLIAGLLAQVGMWINWWHRVPPLWPYLLVMALYVGSYFLIRPTKIKTANNFRQRSQGEWIELSELVDCDNCFRPCPVCGGKVVQSFPGGWIFPIPTEPCCQGCKVEFRTERHWLTDGFRLHKSQ